MTEIRNLRAEQIARTWTVLEKYTYEFKRPDGVWETQVRESYNRGNGVTVLLYNKETKKILLTRQFRLPTYINGNKDGLLIETCAGKLNAGENPDEAIRREIEEETGHRVESIKKVFEAYMSPGSVTEIIYFYTAPYHAGTRVNAGGGLAEEQENIDVLEVSLDEALKMVSSGEIRDAKTIMLLQYAKLDTVF